MFSAVLPSLLLMCFVLFFFWYEPRLRDSARHIFFLNLVVVDVFFIVAVGLQAFHELNNAHSIPITECIIFAIVSMTCIVNGIGCITIMAVERYISICHPLRYHSLINSASIRRCLVVIWIIPSISTLIEACFFFMNDLSLFPTVSDCNNLHLGKLFRNAYTFICLRITESVVLLIISSAITIASYVGVIRAAKNASVHQSSFDKARKTIQLHVLQLILYLSTLLAIPIYECWDVSDEEMATAVLQMSMYVVMFVIPSALREIGGVLR
uniref:Odorant receptor 131-2-like n=1 Tax=Petromyzon marinus TaxID=7757 RepID=A0AAJ7TWJ0_PETMA|nr:odorant receptor 131-2-like [Petromyzon marinus]